MKLTKKLITLIIVLCMTLGLSMVSYAADGKLMFTDPSTAVGQTVEVKGVIEVAQSLRLGDMRINLKYDTTMLKFLSAEEVTESEPGKLTFLRVGQESPNRVEYLMYFEVLAEGTTTIDILDCNIWTAETSTNEKVYPSALGSSTITIEAGEVVTDTPAVDETPEQTGSQVIKISTTTTITLLDSISHITLPSRYLATTVTVNGVEFPAWQDTQKTNLCILYATNSNGENALYQYDANEGTYQRFEAPEEVEVEKETISEMLSGLFQDFMDYVILGVGGVFLLFLIIILVLSIKLYNRNAELDELYEEYDLYEEEEEKEVKAKETKAKEPKVEKKPEKSRPVVAKEPVEFVNINEVTVNDIIIKSDDDIDFEDDEIEVEFYEQIPEIVLAEEITTQVTVEEVVEEQVKPVMDSVPVVEEPENTVDTSNEEEEEYYDEDLDLEFEVNFIDLDD